MLRGLCVNVSQAMTVSAEQKSRTGTLGSLASTVIGAGDGNRSW